MRHQGSRLRAAYGCLLLASTSPASHGHGFGQRFDLPLPLWFWVTGAGASIVLSFVVMALFIKSVSNAAAYPRWNISGSRFGRLLTRRTTIATARFVAVFIFLATILSGLIGTSDPFRNLAPTMIWVAWWVGFAFICALIGDIWALVNPLRTLYAWIEAGYARLSGGQDLSRNRHYPRWLGTWPSVAFFLAFAWMELVSPDADSPARLSVAAITYTGFTFAGMYVFGRETWLRHGEAFSVVFALFARFAPTEMRVRRRESIRSCNSDDCRWKHDECVNGIACRRGLDTDTVEWNLRPLAVGLLEHRGVSVSLTVFVLLVLSTVTFDGLLETPWWIEANNALSRSAWAVPLFEAARDAGFSESRMLGSAALVLAPIVFLFFYAACAMAMALSTRTSEPAHQLPIWRDSLNLANAFILTLVPIAIAYHLSHYLSMLLISGQFIIPLLSDPLGAGWDLWGTAEYQVDLSVIDAKFVWYFSTTVIVIGHVAAVYLAHIVALELFPDRARALISQLSMLVLMVAYTMISFWILAQPIVG